MNLSQPYSEENKNIFVLLAMYVLFSIFLVLAVLGSVKVHEISFLGYELLLPAGTVAFALTFLCTDVVSEVWGRKYSFMAIIFGFFIRLLVWGYLYLVLNIEGILPEYFSPAPFWSDGAQASAERIYGGSNRLIFIGIFSFLVSSIIDIQIYHWLKHKHHSLKYSLYIRNNASTMLAQLVNSIIFIGLAFGAKATIGALIGMIVAQAMIKVTVALVDTPVVYLLRNIATGRKWYDFTR